MKKNDLRFVQFQPDKDLLDINFLSMTPEQRGVYWSIKLYLYCNNGRCPHDFEKLKVITNCADVEKVFEKIKNNFVIKNSQIQHKNVNTDLRIVKKFIRDKRKAGLASAKARATALQQCSNTPPTTESNVKESKVNNSNSNTSSTIETVNNSKQHTADENSSSTSELAIKNSDSVSDSLRTTTPACGRTHEDRPCDVVSTSPDVSVKKEKNALPAGPYSAVADSLKVKEQKFALLTHELFKPRTRSDRTCLRNAAAFVRYQAAKIGDEDLFNTAFALAQEAKKTGKKPMAMFMALMKTELGYRKGITKAVNQV